MTLYDLQTWQERKSSTKRICHRPIWDPFSQSDFQDYQESEKLSLRPTNVNQNFFIILIPPNTRLDFVRKCFFLLWMKSNTFFLSIDKVPSLKLLLKKVASKNSSIGLLNWTLERAWTEIFMQWRFQFSAPAAAAAAADVVTAVALFNFSSQNPDELPITENEELTILMGQCDEEGWLMAVNARGDRGYVPENYIEIRSAPAQGLSQQQSFDSSGPPAIMHQVIRVLWHELLRINSQCINRKLWYETSYSTLSHWSATSNLVKAFSPQFDL